jgi:hypothetical protein
MQYALLKYDCVNIGDEIQSLAALRFLPRVDKLLDRDRPNSWQINEPTRVIMNGWFKRFPEDWPLRNRLVQPLLVSMHLSAEHGSSLKELLDDKALTFYKENAPVGCRDRTTQALLSSRGVPAYFSGCLTLTLQKRTVGTRDTIVLVDVPRSMRDYIPLSYRGEVIATTHCTNVKQRFSTAASLLDLYSTARLVLTSRLHCAMPCLAFGTPVLLIRDSFDDVRFDGLKELCQCATTAEIVSGKKTINCETPLPDASSVRSLQSLLIARCKEFVGSAFKPLPTIRAPEVMGQLCCSDVLL